jgi:hypothetical protein
VRQRKIPVACVQTRAADREAFDGAWPAVLAALERAARGGAALIVLPEGTVPAYVLGEEPVDEGQLDAARLRVSRIARAFGTTIVYGTARASGGRTYNSAPSSDPTAANSASPTSSSCGTSTAAGSRAARRCSPSIRPWAGSGCWSAPTGVCPPSRAPSSSEAPRC